jgi:copper chaperone
MNSKNQAVRFQIVGMSCGHCVQSVTKALAAVPGLVVGKVAVGSAEVTVESEESVKLAIKAMDEAGFEAEASSAANPT